MTESKPERILSYESQVVAASPSRHRRILYCIGLPLIGFGLAGGFGGDRTLNGSSTAIGALLVALALPVRE